MVLADASYRNKELEMLMKAIEKRKQAGKNITTFKELDYVDLETSELLRVPVAELNAKLVRHLKINQNKLSNLDNVYLLKELESINTDNNQIGEIDFKELHNLKVLSMAHNQLKTLEGLSSKIFYLNASANQFVDLKGLENTPSLRILILTHSCVRDISHVQYLTKLLYLDISHSNLPDKILEDVTTSECLQYLDVSHNVCREFPELSSPSLFELRMESNMLSQLRITNWLFNLRILCLADNQIMDILPLAMCPFLRELDLSNNHIKGSAGNGLTVDVKSMASIVVCQDLKVLNLSGNTVIKDLLFPFYIGTFLTKLEKLNGLGINPLHSTSSNIFFYSSLLKTARFCLSVKLQIHGYIQDEEPEVDVESFEMWERFSKEKEKAFRLHLGKYYHPYLKYLSESGLQLDVPESCDVQEDRVFWLSEAVHEMINQSKSIPLLTLDGLLYQFELNLKKKADICRITFIQSLWRTRAARQRYQHTTRAVRLIQRAFRKHRACQRDRRELHRLRKAIVKEELAAIQIQRIFKGYRVRKNNSFKKKKAPPPPTKAVSMVKVHKEPEMRDSVEELFSHLEDHTEIDDWLKNEEKEQEFDKQMQKYLANEKLQHYPKQAHKKKKKHKKDKARAVAASEDSDSDSDDDGLLDLDDVSDPPTPHPVDYQHTLQLADQRHKIENNVSMQHDIPLHGHISKLEALMMKSRASSRLKRYAHSSQPDHHRQSSQESDFPPQTKLKTLNGGISEVPADFANDPTQLGLDTSLPPRGRSLSLDVQQPILDRDQIVAGKYREKDFEFNQIQDHFLVADESDVAHHFFPLVRGNPKEPFQSNPPALHSRQHSKTNQFFDGSVEETVAHAGQHKPAWPTSHSQHQSEWIVSRAKGSSMSASSSAEFPQSNPPGSSERNHAVFQDPKSLEASPLPGTKHSRGLSDAPRSMGSSGGRPRRLFPDKPFSSHLLDPLPETDELASDNQHYGSKEHHIPNGLETLHRPAGASGFVPGYQHPHTIPSVAMLETDKVLATSQIDHTATDYFVSETGSDAEAKGWSQYSQKTLHLLRKKAHRYEKLQEIAKDREDMKDPAKRLEMFQLIKEKLERELDETASVESAPLRGKRIPAIPTVYEWDIHPGDVSKKLLPAAPAKPSATKSINIVGNSSFPRYEGYCSTDPIPHPPVTLLVNNYVKNKVLKDRVHIIDPNTIHQLPSRKDAEPTKTFSTLLNMIPTKISVPEYGTYDLGRNAPLPSIVSTKIIKE
ncbi:hypothetical protein HDU91_005126 [Kappamyces sp. JEL0680]|nr:hypothetical protein HDU91_005126 [Kappamyces sp. JEL0680]